MRKKELNNYLTYLNIQNSQYIQHYDSGTRIKNIDKIHNKNLSYRMSYYNDCLNLEIARHTTLSDAEYFSLNLS